MSKGIGVRLPGSLRRSFSCFSADGNITFKITAVMAKCLRIFKESLILKQKRKTAKSLIFSRLSGFFCSP